MQLIIINNYVQKLGSAVDPHHATFFVHTWEISDIVVKDEIMAFFNNK